MATKSWRGGAGAIRQKTTITMALVWAEGDTVTVKIGNASLVYTVGTAVATTDIAALVNAAINAASATSALIGDETINAGGRELSEFIEVSSTALGSVVTVEGVAGVPFTLTASESTAGTGTATGATSQAASGPNHADNADNWSTGALPVSGDVIRFDQPAPDCLYGLGIFVTGTVDADWIFTTDFAGNVGLPAQRVAVTGSGGYTEYRTRYLALYDILNAKDLSFITGDSGGSGGIIRLNGSAFDCADIAISNPGTAKAEPSVQLYGGKSETFYAGDGWIVLDPKDSGVTTGHELDDLIVGATGKAGPQFTLGSAVLFDTAITGVVNSGTVEVQCVLDQGADEMALTIKGGMVESRGTQAHAAVTIEGGATYKWSGSGTAAGAIAVHTGGILDLRGSGESQSYAGGVTAYGNSTIHKGGHTLAPTFTGCTVDQVTITT